jgi:hypothetical protein
MPTVMIKIIASSVFLLQSFILKANNGCTISMPAVFSQDKLPPVVISKFYGELQYGIAVIHWKTYEEGSNSQFFIERSENGKDFEEIGRIENTSSLDGINFKYKDTMPLPTGFYRLKTVQADTVYSDILRLSSISGIPSIKVWPLVFDALITVEINSKINESFTITLTDSKSKVLSSRLLNAEKGDNAVVLDDAISFLYADEYTMTVSAIKYNYSKKIYKK